MNKRFNFSIIIALIAILFTAVLSCSKSAPFTVPPSRASFLGVSSGTYYVLDDPNSSYAIHVGFTNASTQDRTINFSVTQSSNAQPGTDYTVPATSLTVPAGQLVDSLVLKGFFAGFADGHVDTLTFAITSDKGGTEGLSGDSTFTLVLNKSCPYTVDNFSGNMQVITDEWADYSPGDIIPVQKIDDTHVSFEYAAADAQPIIIAIDPVANSTSVAKQVYGNYGAADGNFSAASVSGSADNYIDPCGHVLSLQLHHTSSTGADYAPAVIVLKKVE